MNAAGMPAPLRPMNLISYCPRAKFVSLLERTIFGTTIFRENNVVALQQAHLNGMVRQYVIIVLDSLCDDIDFRFDITRAYFEDLCADLFYRATISPIERVLADAKISKSQLDVVLLIGGSTRIPKARMLLDEFFSGKTLT
ncbi:hypothetical protein niasHS_008792 [Heterodera schachtii]|uniref:Heat shock protein 70 n=1 Tax=Heterodera schachtii TaxID=97005 RepID=A0ABD2JC97_HETSC